MEVNEETTKQPVLLTQNFEKIEEQEISIEQMFATLVDLLKSTRSLFRKDKEKINVAVNTLKVLGGYVNALHKQNTNIRQEIKKQGGLQERSVNNEGEI